MTDIVQEARVWPVNENGAIVVQADEGSDVVAGYIPSNLIPQNVNTGAVHMVLPASSGGSSNARALAIKYSIALG